MAKRWVAATDVTAVAFSGHGLRSGFLTAIARAKESIQNARDQPAQVGAGGPFPTVMLMAKSPAPASKSFSRLCIKLELSEKARAIQFCRSGLGVSGGGVT